jgi:hypothetical protein
VNQYTNALRTPRSGWRRAVDAFAVVMALVMIVAAILWDQDRKNDAKPKKVQSNSAPAVIDVSEYESNAAEAKKALADFGPVTSADLVSVEPDANGNKVLSQVKKVRYNAEKKYWDQWRLEVVETPAESTTGVNLVAWSPVKGTPTNSGCRTVTVKLYKQRDYGFYIQTFYIFNDRVSWCWMIYGTLYGYPNRVVYNPTSQAFYTNMYIGFAPNGPVTYNNKFFPVYGMPKFGWDNWVSQQIRQCLATQYICNYVANPWINVRAYGNGTWAVNKGGTN